MWLLIFSVENSSSFPAAGTTNMIFPPFFNFCFSILSSHLQSIKSEQKHYTNRFKRTWQMDYFLPRAQHVFKGMVTHNHVSPRVWQFITTWKKFYLSFVRSFFPCMWVKFNTKTLSTHLQLFQHVSATCACVGTYFLWQASRACAHTQGNIVITPVSLINMNESFHTLQ